VSFLVSSVSSVFCSISTTRLVFGRHLGPLVFSGRRKMTMSKLARS
jgi:hypothetical protein